MGNGKIGTSTGTLINVRYRRNKKSRPCNCKKCSHSRVVDDIVYCMLSGNVDVKKHRCRFYEGPFIKEPKKRKVTKRKKVKRKPRKQTLNLSTKQTAKTV